MRLKIACDQVITELNKYNVKYLKPCAGFFILVDFSNVCFYLINKFTKYFFYFLLKKYYYF